MKKTFTLLLSAFIGFSATTNAQIINTIAGSGGAGYDGDGPALTKELNSPWGVAVDAAQNVYVADMANDIIRKITPTGAMTTIGGQAGNTMFLGDGIQATDATFNTPMGVAVDASGNVYVADQGNNRIRMIDVAGVVHTVAGNNLIGGLSGDGGPATAADLYNPTGVFVTPTGELYIADYGNGRIRKVDASGIITTVAGTTPGYTGDGGPATSAQLREPYDVAVDAAGNIFIADWYWKHIRKVNTSGIINNFVNTPDRVNSVALDRSGNIYFTCMNHSVYESDPTGAYSIIAGSGNPLVAGFSGDGGLANAALLFNVGAVEIGPTGNIYIADGDNNRIREITFPIIPVAPITGAGAICQGSTTILSDATPGGSWTSSNAGVASINISTGIVTGVAPGNATITYTTPSNLATFLINVTDPTAATTAGKILGLNYACPGTTVILSETLPGGVWSSSNTAISRISDIGLVHAVAPGKTVLTYTVMGTCGAFVSLDFPFTTLKYEECKEGVNGTATITTTGIEAWPNPNDGTFTINMSSPINEQVQVTITNVIGQKVTEYTTVTNKATITKLEGAGGVYFINAISEHGRWSQKVLVNAAR